MEIIGRITKDATVSETKAGKKVVNFSIANNDTYKTKGSSEVQKITTFVNCAYWINPGMAVYLTKGTLVECYSKGADVFLLDKNGRTAMDHVKRGHNQVSYFILF